MKEKALKGLQFGLSELAGSLGDFGTIIPLVITTAAVAHLNTAVIFFFFGIWFIIIGLYYRLPIPVEPMKVIAVIAITEGLASGEIAAAGIILGFFFLFLGFGDILVRIERWIPQCIIRGIQLGLALLLIKTSGVYLVQDPVFFILGIAIIALFSILAYFMKFPDISSLVLVCIAVGIGILLYGLPNVGLMTTPVFSLPDLNDFNVALTQLVIPQSLLTITNAILATALLTKDLFSRDVGSRNLSRTIGLMNLTSVPFGGFPMCHGAGGLAGQYRFGARTGGANIYAGVIFLVLALFFVDQGVIEIIQVGFYGALLVFVALELGRHSIKTDSYLVTGVVGVIAVLSSMTIGFLAGLLLFFVISRLHRKKIVNS